MSDPAARRARAEAALVSAYVADAAAMGLHWLYDPERIADLDGPLAFRDADPQDFAGAKGVFVHHGKRAGDLSHYGQQMRAMVQALRVGAFDAEAYQARFAALFGPGGAWSGYIDRPTRGTLANLTADRKSPSGVEDDQHPAIAKLPPLLALPGGATDAQIVAAVEVTNLGEPAIAWSRAFAAMLAAALDGADMQAALDAGEAAAPADLAAALAAARASSASAVDFAGEVGRACHLPQGLPTIARILTQESAAEGAILANIRAGGDSCGRAVPLGALLGAVHGIGGAAGLPAAWTLKLTEGPALAAEIEAALGRRP
ncbi:MAG: ADP-ribosylglycohydrolase family protein [Pseudomonadota bacterium]